MKIERTRQVTEHPVEVSNDAGGVYVRIETSSGEWAKVKLFPREARKLAKGLRHAAIISDDKRSGGSDPDHDAF